jgi:hypothetical protein
VLAHVRHLTPDAHRQLAHRELAAGERLEDAETLRVGERPTDEREPLPIEIVRSPDINHGRILTLIAQVRK